MRNFRVYKEVQPDGSFCFVFRDETAMAIASCIENLVKSLKGYVVGENYSICFSPFHDIEYCTNLKPLRCLPLSENEKEDFWKFLAN